MMSNAIVSISASRAAAAATCCCAPRRGAMVCVARLVSCQNFENGVTEFRVLSCHNNCQNFENGVTGGERSFLADEVRRAVLHPRGTYHSKRLFDSLLGGCNFNFRGRPPYLFRLTFGAEQTPYAPPFPPNECVSAPEQTSPQARV